MRKNKDLLLGMIALIVLVVITFWLLRLLWSGLGVVWAGMLSLVDTVSTLDTVLVIALISSAITVLGLIVNSIISIIIKASEHRSKVKAELRAKMEKPYSEFVSLIFDIMANTKQEKVISDEEITNRMVLFSKEVTLYGSNKVVRRWAKYRISLASKPPLAESMLQLENILFAIREDLGVKKRGMKKGELLALFINDIEEILQNKKAP
ncbi:MAG: hypothetical protein FWE12_03155 [Oscillospiraceae bacterium]|nr:hypothetical protein [Oscillospiraceae bacterium]